MSKEDNAQEMNHKLESIKIGVAEGHQWILERLEQHIRGVVSDTINKKSVERTGIEVMLYNFTDGEVPESIRKLFENGMESVPQFRMEKKEIDDRVEEALVQYLMRLCRRKRWGNPALQAKSVQAWIVKVNKANLSQEGQDFVERLENAYPGIKAELDLSYRNLEIDTKEEMVKKLEQEGCVLVMCDKGMGMSLFTLETMRKADLALITQLGAQKMVCTKDEIIESVKNEIKQFDKELTVEQKKYHQGPLKVYPVDFLF